MSRRTVRQALLALGLGLTLSACGLMQSMMTTSVDETAGAKVLAFTGSQEVKRMNAEGNTFDVTLRQGDSLKTADLVIGSDDEGSTLLLQLADQDLARFDEADFVLRSPLGEDSDEFAATVELGRVLLALAGDPEQRFTLIDTNKNRVNVTPPARLYVVIDDDGMAVFVKEGRAALDSERSELELTLAAGEGRHLDGAGVATPFTPPADLVWDLKASPEVSP